MAKKRIGLIVNPVAGLGGRVGLKGSDGVEIQQRARLQGAVPQAGVRAARCLEVLAGFTSDFELLTMPGEMGADPAQSVGLNPRIIASLDPGFTRPQDTQRAARLMLDLQADLVLFAGGDGTARDLLQAVGTDLLLLGIPAGVKIHSAAFATNPLNAGRLAADFLQGKPVNDRLVEVVDSDEDAVRQGIVSTRLYGYLRILFERRMVQGVKSDSPQAESAALQSIADELIEQMKPDWLYILGPGTTVRALTDRLGVQKTLLGVDILLNNRLAATDVNEAQILEMIRGQQAMAVITPIGGQGYLLGRGNQPISPAVLRQIGFENLIVVSTFEKLQALGSQPLLVDTGDERLDQALSGYVRVITGYHESLVYRVAT